MYHLHRTGSPILRCQKVLFEAYLAVPEERFWFSRREIENPLLIFSIKTDDAFGRSWINFLNSI